MKRTTYILIGTLITGLLAMVGIIFYLFTLSYKVDDTFLEIGGQSKTVQLPACKAIEFMIKVDQPHYVRQVSFLDVPFKVQPADSTVASLTYAAGLDTYMTMHQEGDTLKIIVDFSEDELDKKFRGMRWIRARSEEIRLAIPTTVQQIMADGNGMEVTFSGLRSDTLSFHASDGANLEDCQITALTAQASRLWFKSGAVRDLYLNLDGCNWKVNVDSFKIDTEHLSGSMAHRCPLQKGECRQVYWTPTGKNGSLSLILNEATKIEVDNFK